MQTRELTYAQAMNYLFTGRCKKIGYEDRYFFETFAVLVEGKIAKGNPNWNDVIIGRPLSRTHNKFRILE